MSGIGRRADRRGAWGILTRGHQLRLAVLFEPQRSIAGGRHFEEQRAGAGEVTQHEPAVAVPAGQRAGVAVDAQDGR
ncbi:MAG: hypothetical protein HYZ58_09030 [Acidobacteria bacterium]|nr:hypothetical protein [Acidobacteriota bacterium]